MSLGLVCKGEGNELLGAHGTTGNKNLGCSSTGEGLRRLDHKKKRKCIGQCAWLHKSGLKFGQSCIAGRDTFVFV